MPLYRYQCIICKEEFDEFNTIEHRHRATHCKHKARLVITAPQIMTPFKEHYNWGLGQRITSLRQKKEVMKRLNCEEVGDSGADKIKDRRKELINASTS